MLFRSLDGDIVENTKIGNGSTNNDAVQLACKKEKAQAEREKQVLPSDTMSKDLGV